MDDLAHLFEHMKTCSRNAFKKHGQCLPMFVTIDPPFIIPGIWHNNAEKRLMVAMVKALFKESGVTRYAFAFEAWFAMEEITDRTVDFDAIVMPSERPDRQECIMVIAEEKGRDPMAGMWHIERDKRGRGKITTFTVADKNSHHAIGAFRNMLGAEILH